jgi:hypothetical protein
VAARAIEGGGFHHVRNEQGIEGLGPTGTDAQPLAAAIENALS